MRIEERIIKEAKIILRNYWTIREVADHFKVSKSTVHKDLTSRLEKIDYQLYLDVRHLMEYNKKVRHIRGGESTRKIYILKKSTIN